MDYKVGDVCVCLYEIVSIMHIVGAFFWEIYRHTELSPYYTSTPIPPFHRSGGGFSHSLCRFEHHPPHPHPPLIYRHYYISLGGFWYWCRRATAHNTYCAPL